MSPPYTIHVTIDLKPGTEELFYTALKPLWEEIQADETLLYFNVFTNHREPGVIRMTEIWNAEIENLQAKLPTRKHYHPFMDAIKDILLKEHKVEIFTAVDGFKFVRE